MAPIKVGLMGYGFSTKCFHLPFILPNPDLEVHAFLQRKEAPAGTSSAEAGVHCTVDHPNAKHYRTADDFFADAALELVIICTGHDSHYELAEKALLAGKHVVVEKPFTITSTEADKLIALAKKQGKLITCFQNRRYDSDFRTLQHLVAQNAFGKVTEFENHYDMDNPEWVQKWTDPEYVPGEGMLYGIGTHSIDQTLLLFGRPKSVTAFTRTLRGKNRGADDSFTIVLQYGGEQEDLISTIKTTIVSPVPMDRMLKYLVRGTQGAFIKNGEDPQIDHLMSGMKADDPAFGVEPDSYHGYVSSTEQLDAKLKPDDRPAGRFSGSVTSKQGSYLDYYRDLVAAIRGEKELVVKPEESRDGIRVIELARESAERGVTVPWT
ncbi:hypothetical protein LTR36_000373 [Oleoguttula mirabilis]|uniref:Oxidoreductase n=1 Tax=Oleoguttula mirabilis TaxID=1507867 RepID=A0AAV9JYY2_9PEZI|nr:hypothetical protein LTR36_000373 [Oleoguttula mirabilis]